MHPTAAALIATWHPATGFASLEALDRRAWRGVSRFDGTPLADGWQPPRMALLTAADVGDLPIPDVIRTGTMAPVVSSRAAEALMPLWGSAVEYLSLDVDEDQWLAVNAVEVIRALDPDRSVLQRFESSGRVMAIDSHVFTAALRPPIFRDALAPALATFIDERTIAACAAAGLTGLDARVVWPPGGRLPDLPGHALTSPPPAGDRPEVPPDVAPGSGTAVAGGYRLTDDDTHTWIAPDRDAGAWFALRIPSGWRDVGPMPDDEITLRSDGQATTVLGVRRLPLAGRPSRAAIEQMVLARPGRRLLVPATAGTVDGQPAVRLRASDDADAARPLALGVLVVQVGPDQLVVTTATDDLTGAELDLVDGVALNDLVVRWLG